MAAFTIITKCSIEYINLALSLCLWYYYYDRVYLNGATALVLAYVVLCDGGVAATGATAAAATAAATEYILHIILTSYC